MCLTYKHEYKAESIDGWKAFAYKDGILKSYFSKYHPEYEPNVVNKHISLDFSPGFYIFKNEASAYNIIFNKSFWARWTDVNIVLPVTLYDVTHKGLMIQDNDEQCIPMKYESFIGKRIVVHYNEENVKRFKKMVQKHYIDKMQYSVDPQHLEIMKELIL